MTGEIEFQDVYEGEYQMEEKREEKYLGDIVSSDGRNIKNIKSRIAKGTGIVNKILTMLDGIPFGKHYFKVGVLLRDSLLVSSMLFNCEAWYNLTSAELDLLETIDLYLLRSILKAPKGTPKEMFYLELGCIPFRDIIRERRLRFLHSILNEDKKSMMNRYFQAQLNNPTKKDWVTTVKEDLKILNMEDKNFDIIRKMKKTSFVYLIQKKTNQLVYETLEKAKKKHSKVRKLEHSCIKIQKYLQPNKMKMSREEAQLIFAMRCRVTEVKINLKGKYDSLECGACGLAEESQQHIIECEKISDNKHTKVIYEKLLNGTVEDKLKIARAFKENFEKLENTYK